MTMDKAQPPMQRLMPWIYSLFLHAGFLVLLVLSIHWSNSTLPSLGGQNPNAQPVQATVVDQSLIQQQMALLQAQERQKQEAQQKLQQQAAAAKSERQQEEQKLAQLKQQQQQAQAAINKQLADLQQQARTEQEKVAKLKAAEAKAAVQEKQRQSAAAAHRRKQLQAEIAAEEKARDARLASLSQQYQALIQQSVYSNWIVPPSVTDATRCVVSVQQVPGGAVTDVRVLQCNGDDAVQQSVVTAVYKSSPLPPPPDPSLFLRQFQLTFKKLDKQ